MEVPIGLGAEVMDYDALSHCYATLDPGKSEYLMLYMFRPETYRCQVVLPESGLEGPDFSLTVDTPEDLERSGDVRPTAGGLVRQELPQDPKAVLPPLSRGLGAGLAGVAVTPSNS